MTRAIIFSALCLIAALVALESAQAGKNDDAWARCLWERMPASTSNWLKMPSPKRDYGLGDPPREYVLQFRLQAACYTALTAPGKARPPGFNAGSVRKALLNAKPSVTGQDKTEPRAYRCTRYFLNDTQRKNPAGFDWGFGDDETKAQFFSVTYMFAAQSGGTVGLPNKGGLRRCEYIQPDGSFQAAAS